MMITSAICWGSWANTYKGVKNYRFELFYWDYAIGIFLISLILGHTMGSTTNDATSLVNNIHSARFSNVFWTTGRRCHFQSCESAARCRDRHGRTGCRIPTLNRNRSRRRSGV